MLTTRIIPTLLLRRQGLVKGQQFRNHRYVGDPINTVKIFNEKEVDELIFLDISAREGNGPNLRLLKDIASETFMPLAYGGGITKTKQIEELFKLGIEKVILNTESFLNPQLIQDAVSISGAQSIVASLDVKKNIWGQYKVYIKNGTLNTKEDPLKHAKNLEQLGVGEIMICSINKEGTRQSYDLQLINSICNTVTVPVIAAGGAGSFSDLKIAIEQTNASALAAGDLFVFRGKHKAVLISYPEAHILNSLQEKRL